MPFLPPNQQRQCTEGNGAEQNSCVELCVSVCQQRQSTEGKGSVG